MSKKQVTSGTKAKKTIVNIIIHIFLAILSFIWVLPIFWVVLTSFRGEKGSYVTTFFPKTYTINNYVKLFTDTSILNFPKMFMNTFIIAIFTCIISTIFVLSVSYTMSRMRFNMRKPFMNVAMILGLFPSFMSMIAVYYSQQDPVLDSMLQKVSLTRSRRRWTRLRSSMGQQDGRYLPKLPRHSVNQLLFIPF